MELIHLEGQKQFRIIPAAFPILHFFEDLADPSDMEILWEIESLTNERIRQDTGDFFLVSAKDRVSGQGSSVVMAAFTHVKLSRFSNGSFGVYYAGLSTETAIRETVYHRERFLSATQEDACEITMRLYEGKIKKPLYDIRDNKKYQHLHHPNDYIPSQQFGEQLRKTQAWGLIYNSVRHDRGSCIAIYRPPAISIPKQLTYLRYIWDGEKITDVLDTRSILNFAH